MYKKYNHNSNLLTMKTKSSFKYKTVKISIITKYNKMNKKLM